MVYGQATVIVPQLGICGQAPILALFAGNCLRQDPPRPRWLVP